MAFPYITEANFEDGTLGHFDVETDTETRLDFPHYTELARYPHTHTLMPWRGAYCMRVKLENDGTPADAYLQETGSWDMTTGTNELYVRFMVGISPDIVMANADEFKILDFWSSTNTPEAGVMVNYTTANGYRLGIGKATASSFKGLTLGVWNCVEVYFNPAGGAGGTLDAWLNGASFTQVSGLTNANITSGVFGVIGQDAGTTTGTVLFDSITTDDARLFPFTERWPNTQLLTKSGHVFVGPGELAHINLLSGAATDNVITVFDTDTGYSSTASNLVSELKNTANSQTVPEFPIKVHRGCYAQLAGTNPRAIVRIASASRYSEGAMRSLASVRRPNPAGA